MEWYVVYISYESFKAITYMTDAFIIYIVLIVEAIGRRKGTTEDWRICFFIVVLFYERKEVVCMDNFFSLCLNDVVFVILLQKTKSFL